MVELTFEVTVNMILNVMLHGRLFATTIFSATQHYSIVATSFRMVATLLQHCCIALRIVDADRFGSHHLKVMLHGTIRNDDF